MDPFRWTKAESLICPDCGYTFGTRTAAGSLTLAFDLDSLREQCRRSEQMHSAEIHCPRFEEAKAAADRSERTG
jgi:primosomal protein N'